MSNNSYQFFVVLDLTSYGSALAILNQFADDDVVKVFEISPTGSAAFLLLATKNLVDAEVLASQIKKIYKDDILEIELILKTQEEVLQTYLSQNTPKLKKNLAVLELDRISKAFFIANETVKNGMSLVDFRVVRTFPCNIILTITSDETSELLSIKNKYHFLKTTIISDVQSTLKSYFEIIK